MSSVKNQEKWWAQTDREEGMEGAKEIIPVAQIELKHLLTLPSSTCEVTPTSAPLIYYYCQLWNTTIVRLDRGGFIGNYKNYPDSISTLPCLSKIS